MFDVVECNASLMPPVSFSVNQAIKTIYVIFLS